MALRDGVLLLDKPAGPTSFQTVAIARGVLRAAWGGPRPRVGHAGSLDPLATGLLVVMVGAATRLSPWLMGLDKTYHLTARFGVGTDTLDADGAVTGRLPVACGPEALAAALARFRGGIDQVPPAYSALKRDGERLYKLARQGRELPELAPRRVQIDRLELLATRWGVTPDRGDTSPGSASSAVSSEADAGPPLSPDDLIHEADLVVDCTSGTYVRALVRDLAAALGTLGHVRRLRRERVGPFVVTDAVPPDALRDAAALAGGLRAPAAGIAHLPEMRLRADEARAVRHGAAPEPAWLARLGRAPWEDPKSGDQFFTLLDETGELAAVVTRRATGGTLRLAAVFAAPGAPDRGGAA